MRARTSRASAAALEFGNSDSMRTSTSSAGSTPPRVIVRKLSSALTSADVCGFVKQLAVMKAGIEAPAKIMTPTMIKISRGLRKLSANFEFPSCILRRCAVLKQNYPEGDSDCDVKTFRVGDLI